jgi:hypothetical protein
MKLQYILIILLFSSYSIQAQTGSIEGKVINAKNNEPLAFVNIIIDGTTTGSVSDLDGHYSFKGLKPGYYKLVASSIGFEKAVTSEFLVSNNKSAYIDIPMTETVINLKEVEVTTAAFERKEESPLSMRELGIQDIEKNPGGNRDISKVIQSLPGVVSTPAFRNDVIVRGGGASENKFFLDDVEIPNLNHFATQGASGGPVGMINTDFLREVNFYSGSFPANRGNALSSIVDMKLIDGNKDRLNFKLTLGASDYGLTMDGPLGKKTTFLISARRSYLKLLFSALQLPFLPTYNDFQLKTKIELSKKDQLSIIGLGAIDQFKLNLKADKTDQQKYILYYIPVTNQWNYALGVVYKHFRQNSYDTWVVSRNMLNNRSYKYKNNDDSNEGNLLQDYVSDEIENKIRFENTSRRQGLKLTWGAGAEYARYTNKTYQKIFLQSSERIIDYQSSLDLYKWNLFIQASKGFFKERLLVTLGARADGNSYNKEMSDMIRQLSPRLSVSWMFNENWSINMNTGRYTQQPAYTTLGYRDNNGTLVNKENGLRYITADHAVLGFGYTDNKHIQLTVEGFYKSYRHYPFSLTDSISLASKGTDFGTVGDEAVSSTSKGHSYGAELLFRIKMLKGFNVLISYTWVRSMFTGRDNTYAPSAWDNRNLVNLTFSKNFKRNWYVGLKWKYLGGAPYTPWDLEQSSLIAAWDVRGRTFPDYALFNTGRLKSYHQLDIRGDKEWYFKKWSLNLYVDIQNVYNSKATGPDNYIVATDENGQPLINTTDPSRYVLKAIPNSIGNILPTLGIILQF